MSYQYVFGPVLSRRLGISLGLDIIPFKTCSMDCVYCECGPTTCLSLERHEYIPVEKVLAELDDCLSKKPELNYITFSGGGEPTLNSGIGKIVRHIKTKYPQYKICLLTNSFSLGSGDLIDDLKIIDLVIPSLDASSEKEFKKINRPAEGLKLADIVESLVTFRKASKAAFWLELFMVPDVNDSDLSIKRFAKLVKKISPDKVQLNSLDRPPAASWVQSVPEETAERFKKALQDICPVEIIGKVVYKKPDVTQKEIEELDQKILKLITKRPCTLEDIAFALKADDNIIIAELKALESKKSISSEERKRGRFYRAIASSK